MHNKSDMENMKMQYDCGAISRQTIIDKSPYTTDTALELERIESEKEQAEQTEIQEVKDIEDADTENKIELEEVIDDKVD